MRFKYVVYIDGGFPQFDIFPATVQHLNYAHLNPISAGFCQIVGGEIKCFGESVGLRIKSRGEEDDQLIKTLYKIG